MEHTFKKRQLTIADKLTSDRSFLITKPHSQRPIKTSQTQSIRIVAGILANYSSARNTDDLEPNGHFLLLLFHLTRLLMVSRKTIADMLSRNYR